MSNQPFVFQLPIGYRPTATERLVVLADDLATRLEIFPDGWVRVYRDVETYLSLDGLSFRAAP